LTVNNMKNLFPLFCFAACVSLLSFSSWAIWPHLPDVHAVRMAVASVFSFVGIVLTFVTVIVGGLACFNLYLHRSQVYEALRRVCKYAIDYTIYKFSTILSTPAQLSAARQLINLEDYESHEVKGHSHPKSHAARQHVYEILKRYSEAYPNRKIRSLNRLLATMKQLCPLHSSSLITVTTGPWTSPPPPALICQHLTSSSS